MTLLRAPPCRLVLRLHRPAVTAPRRFLSHLKRHELNRPLHVSLKPTHDYVHLRKGFATSEHPLSPDIHSSDILLVDSATIVPASVAAAKPEHFVNQIRPLEPLADFHKTNLVVFLATPSFAPWLLDDRIFVEKALAKLYKNLSGTPDPLQNMQAICAVVDRLPEAKAVAGESGRRVVMGDSGSRAQQPPVAETGHEGIAYVVLPAKAQASAQPKIDGEIGCIDFLAHTHTDASGGDYTRVRVPLANTVFQTGKPCTLTASSWEWSRGENKPVLQSWRERKTVVINLSTTGATPTPSLLQDRLHQEAPVLSIPLLPLTMPRQVDGHMGNIIRGIIGPDEAKITASTELEKVVPRYFKSRGEPAQATSAWALVIPKDRAHIALKDTRQLLSNVLGADVESMSSEDYKVREQQGFESLWQQQPPRWNVMIQEALMRGARLHKVLSGGGGWGKKAGLLSLDPVPVGPPARELPADEAMADDYDSVDEFSTALKPVVEDGDFIQFFISAIPAAEGADTAAFTHLKEAAKPTSGHAWNWEFGVIPSTVDSIPGGSWQHTGKPSEDMAVFRGTFGALSEGGLTLMHARNVHEETGVAKENINTTTVDVPFSRWSAFRLHSRDGVKTGAAGDSENNAGIPS